MFMYTVNVSKVFSIFLVVAQKMLQKITRNILNLF